MQLKLHSNATTTPRTRQYIRESTQSTSFLANELGVTQTTIRRWRSRIHSQDRSHTRHNLGQSTSETEEALIAQLRTEVGLSLDDIVEVMKRCVNDSLTRSSIHRCLRRLGISKKPISPHETVGKFDDHPCGFIHMDVKYLTKLENKRSYVYVAIDRATRYVYAEVLYDLKPSTTAGFIERFLKAFSHPVHTIISDNGFEWTDRFEGNRMKRGEKGASGKHPVDVVCAENKIEHKLIRPAHPQTNGMVERFNRKINEAIANKIKVKNNQGKNSFMNHHERNLFLDEFIKNYNNTKLKCLKYQSPNQALYNQTGLYTKAGVS